MKQAGLDDAQPAVHDLLVGADQVVKVFDTHDEGALADLRVAGNGARLRGVGQRPKGKHILDTELLDVTNVNNDLQRLPLSIYKTSRFAGSNNLYAGPKRSRFSSRRRSEGFVESCKLRQAAGGRRSASIQSAGRRRNFDGAISPIEEIANVLYKCTHVSWPTRGTETYGERKNSTVSTPLHK